MGQVSGWHTIRPQIKAVLDTVTELAFVKASYTQDVTGFPAAMFEASSDSPSFETNREDVHVYAFDIIIIQEMEQLGRDEGERVLGAAVDAVTYAFLNNDTINGTCLWCEPIPSAWTSGAIGEGAVKWARLTLKCHVLHEKA
jgi:hypothetical protein